MLHAAKLVIGLLALAQPADADLAHLREALEDRLDPRGQSQAALMLVQSDDPGAEKLVRQALRQAENEDTFLALAGAVRMRQDSRFFDELMAALVANRPRLRQAVAEALAALPHPDLVKRLACVADDARADVRLRQTAAWALGRCGRKAAAEALVGLLADDSDELRRVAGSALSEISGQPHGHDAAQWRAWWARHKDHGNEEWLAMRANFQAARAARLEGELLRCRAQALRLHQQLYARLPVPDRLAYLQAAVDQDDPGVRALAVVWCLELLPGSSGERHKLLADVLMRLTRDGAPEVRRAAVLALGRVGDAPSFERLLELIASPTPAVRAAAARALATAAAGDARRARQKEVISALQKALEDRAPEVVVEAAEALGALGAPEAGPVLTGLLRHPSEHVRQTAAQALERTADAALLDGLLRGLDDPNVTVRFGLVGAIGKAAGGSPPGGELGKRVLARLEALLEKDADQGVRGRAATVLGEVGGPASLRALWAAVLAGGEGRVQEKAWDAFIEAIVRSGSAALLAQWDRALSEAKQPSRRTQLLARVYARWDQQPATREPAGRALEALAAAQLEQGKWAAAAPLVQGLLTRAEGGDEGRARHLRSVVAIAELALREGGKAEAARLLQETRGFLAQDDPLAETFDRLQGQAKAD